MPNPRKILLVSFLALTIFFSAILGYTLFVDLWREWLRDAIQVSLNGVEIQKNSSEVTFHLMFKNPSFVDLEIYFIWVDVICNKTTKVASWGSTRNIIFPANDKVTLNVTTKLEEKYQAFLSNNTIWSLDLRFYLHTPLYFEPVKIYRSLGDP